MTSLYDHLNPTETVQPEAPTRCSGITRRGNQCQRVAVEGEELCILCGASLVVAREVIQRRLLALQEKSVGVLEEIFAASDDKTRLSAVIAVLDRTGFGPKSTVEVKDAPEDLSQLSAEELAARTDAVSERARSAASRLRNQLRMNVAPDHVDPVH